MLQFSILGPIEVSSDSGVVEVTAPRNRAFLALLLLNANHRVAKDMLIDRLWGEQPPANAATALQNGIARLRRLLGDEVITTREPGYMMRTGSGQLDVAEFERLRERARSEAPPERAATLRDALGLCRGILRHDPSLQPAAAAGPERQHGHYGRVARALLAGKLVPVLGPQASGAPSDEAPPDPAAAAKRLAEVFGYPQGRVQSLTRV